MNQARRALGGLAARARGADRGALARLAAEIKESSPIATSRPRRSSPVDTSHAPRNNQHMSRQRVTASRFCAIGAVCVFLVVVAAVATASTATAAPNPWKALGAVRSAWKESPEAQVALKVFRKAATTSIKEWRRSEGRVCAWRYVLPTYCSNGRVYALRNLTVVLNTPFGKVTVGYVPVMTTLNAACRTLFTVRVLWPTPGVPSAVANVDDFVFSRSLRWC